jgi:hypothetical protein
MNLVSLKYSLEFGFDLGLWAGLGWFGKAEVDLSFLHYIVTHITK